MHTNQRIPKKIVIRSRFRSTTEQDHHQARDDQDNGKRDDHSCYPSPAIDMSAAAKGAADSSLRCQFTIPADLSELPGVEAGSADESAVDVRLRHDRRD